MKNKNAKKKERESGKIVSDEEKGNWRGGLLGPLGEKREDDGLRGPIRNEKRNRIFDSVHDRLSYLYVVFLYFSAIERT